MSIRSFLNLKKLGENSAFDVLFELHISKNTSVSAQVNSNLVCSTSKNTVPTLATNYTPNYCESYNMTI